MDIFLSYSSIDKKVAAKLRAELEKRGLSVWHGLGGAPGSDWQHQIQEGIRSADNIVILVGPRREPDEAQQATWPMAVEAAWQDPRKRLIPVLLGNAQPPSFVRNGRRVDFQAVRITDSRDLPRVVDGIVKAAKTAPESLPAARSSSLRDFAVGQVSESDPPSSSVPTKTGSFTTVSDEDRAQRRARLAEIKQFAERLKSH